MKMFRTGDVVRYVVIAGALAIGLSVPVRADSIVFSENFNLTTVGSPVGSAANPQYSQRGEGDYYHIAALPAGWSGSPLYLAWAPSSTTDWGILLNEPTGSISTTLPLGLTIGQKYILKFDHWGDNRGDAQYDPNYTVSVKVDDSTYTFNGKDVPQGSATLTNFNTVTVAFTYSGSDGLKFTQGTNREASPIIDNITITAVPDGGVTLMLLGGALVGLETLRRKFRA